MMNSHQIFPYFKHTFVGAEFFGIAFGGIRLFVIDEHHIYSAVTDIAEHIYAAEL